MVALIAAVRSMQLVMARDGSTRQPVTDAVNAADMPALRCLSVSLEGRTEKLKNPHDPVTLAWFCWIVARPGGWSGYTSKGYRPAGPKPCIMACFGLRGFSPDGAWQIVPQKTDSRSP
jgi:hypothetical protein